MGHRRLASFVSGFFIVISIASLTLNGLQLGLDFSSGVAVRLNYSNSVSLEQIQTTLKANGVDEALVIAYGSDRAVRIVLPISEEIDSTEQASQALAMGENLAALLRGFSDGPIELEGSDFVSAKAGQDLAEQSALGVLVALGCIMIYISARFQFKFAVGAVLALVHDVIITLGVFSIFRLSFDLTTLAALLAVIGYSLNDSIIVADRIRENLRRRGQGTMAELVNLSLNQTLSRTLITSGTTLLVIVSLLLVGSDAVFGFCIGMTVGIIAGTYSTIYIASALLLLMKVSREDVAIPLKEDFGSL